MVLEKKKKREKKKQQFIFDIFADLEKYEN